MTCSTTAEHDALTRLDESGLKSRGTRECVHSGEGRNPGQRGSNLGNGFEAEELHRSRYQKWGDEE